MGSQRIHVLVADDDRHIRRSLRTLLCAEHDIDVVGEAADGVEAVHLARLLEPDVVLMDLQMPRMGGIEATRCIVSALPGTRVVAMAVFEDLRTDAIAAGCHCFLLKDSGWHRIVDAVRRAHMGSHARAEGGAEGADHVERIASR